jgi:hypothetical protein
MERDMVFAASFLRFVKRSCVISSIISTLAIFAAAQAADEAPLQKLVINAPSNTGFKQMISDDQSWSSARSAVGQFVLVEGTFKSLSDVQLDELTKKMKAWNISFDLEVGAIKEWSHEGEKSFRMQKGWWDRITSHDGNIASFSMDGPRDKAINGLHLSEDFAADQVAQFVIAIHKAYPHALVGDIEQYPASSGHDHINWIDRLQQRLHELGDRGLDYYRMDVNWAAFNGGRGGSWAAVKAVEDHCHSKNLKFSLIYWASNFPIEKSAGRLSDKTWYDGIMTQARDYAATGNTPDQFVVESWIGLPKQTVPDSGSYTFTNSVRDFARQFVRTNKRRP